jgi:hypothetical protein
MPDYQTSKIYRIVCNETGEQYIGSTTQTLAQRLAQHKCKTSNCKSKKIIERMNYEIVLIEEYPCENKEQLGRRERYFIETMDCVNKYIPTRTTREWRKANPERALEVRKWQKANPDKYAESQRKWKKANREKVVEYQRRYYERKKLGNESPCG